MPRQTHRLLAAALVALGAEPSFSATLDPQFSDHAVIQRGHPVTVTGRADAGETVTVTLGQADRKVLADKAGRFAARFDPPGAAGPVALSLRSESGDAVARDVVVGDVFLCSGQSNMELETRNAQDSAGQIGKSADEGLRLFLVPRAVAEMPQRDFARSVSWKAAGPDTVPEFSAVCLYMAQALRAYAGVPVGAIASSWGGSQIGAWMGEGAQATIGRADQTAMMTLHARDPIAGERAASATWEAWWRRETGDVAGSEPWQVDSALSWAGVPGIGPWDNWGVPALVDYKGMVWFRRAIDLTPEQAGQQATLSLGTMDDVGRAWINGKPVGMSPRSWSPAAFTVPPGLLHAGRNVIVLNIQNGYSTGGLLGPSADIALRFEGDDDVALGEGWDYAVAVKSPAGAPRVPWSDVTGAGTLYNGMIAPLGDFGLRGIAWYQGESDVDIPGYSQRMAAMMADWRRQFSAPDLAVVAVQLASYGRPATRPVESGWAAMRATQQLAMAQDAHGGLATAIDLGDPFDIHPGEKHEIGRRVAMAMQSTAYGDATPRLGPQATSATATADGGAMIAFSGLTGQLHARSSAQAIGFELCGAAAGTCRFVPGLVEGSRVRLAGDGLPATRVRYAWADAPVVNLYDEAPLPVGPIELPIVSGR